MRSTSKNIRICNTDSDKWFYSPANERNKIDRFPQQNSNQSWLKSASTVFFKTDNNYIRNPRPIILGISNQISKPIFLCEQAAMANQTENFGCPNG